MISHSLQPKAPSDENSPLSPLALTHREFALISELAHAEFGIELGPGKEQLVAARIGKLMRHLCFSNFRDFYKHLQADHTGQYRIQLIDSLTTNHTSFFREQAHFDFLVNPICSQWASSRPMRIWSAACSSGEEPYTIALIASEHFRARREALPHILASDISTRALETARNGAYPAQRLQHAMVPWLRKHLLRGEGHWDGWYRMRPEIIDMVDFQRINLVQSWPDIGRFDVIFCRNVMIYFSHQTQTQLVNRLAECLQPGGYLFVGHSETLTGIQHGLQHVQPAIYRKRGAKR